MTAQLSAAHPPLPGPPLGASRGRAVWVQFRSHDAHFVTEPLAPAPAFAEFERELTVERTRAGLQRARRAERVGGRPRVVVNRLRVVEMNQDGMTTGEIADELGISAASVCRIVQASKAA
jgi:hypothetical protein